MCNLYSTNIINEVTKKYSKFNIRSLDQYKEASDRENLRFCVESLLQGQVHLKILENANLEDNSA